MYNIYQISVLYRMSVDTHQYLHNQKLNQQQRMLRNIHFRLEQLQSRTSNHIINNTKCYSNNNFSQKQNNNNNNQQSNQYLQNKMEEINKIIQFNCQSIQEHVNDNYTELYNKMKKMQNQLLRVLNQKQQAIGFLQLKHNILENQQKNIKQIFEKIIKKNDTNEGIKLLEQRISQINQIQKIRQSKYNDSLKIIQQSLTKYIDEKIEGKQFNVDHNNKHSNNDSHNDNDGIIDKIKMLDIANRQHKRKFAELEQMIHDATNKFQNANSTNKNLLRKIQNLQDDVTNIRMKSEEHLNPTTKKQMHNQNLKRQGDFSNSRSGLTKKRTNTQRQTEQPRKNINLNMRKDIYSDIRSKRHSSEEQYEESEHKDQDQQSISERPRQESMGRMGGGIRDLLKKSKDKKTLQHRQASLSKLKQKPQLGSSLRRGGGGLPPRHSPLDRHFQSNPGQIHPRSLPPVRQDPKKLRSAHQSKQFEPEYQQQPEQEGVFNVDEDGYLMDEDGNYLYDDQGEQLRLNQDDLAELLKQQNM